MSVIKKQQCIIGTTTVVCIPFSSNKPDWNYFFRKKIHHYFYRNSKKRYEQMFFEYHTKMVQILQKQSIDHFIMHLY